MQMLLKKMLPELTPKTGYLNPILKRSINQTFTPFEVSDPTNPDHLRRCYLQHKHNVFDYFANRHDFLSIDVSHQDSLSFLLKFLNITLNQTKQLPHLNAGKLVDHWKNHKHPNKIDALSAGKYHRQFFDYQ